MALPWALALAWLFPLPLVLVLALAPAETLLLLDTVVVANTLVGLKDSVAVIRARDMLKDNIITAVRFKIITKINKKLLQKDCVIIFYTIALAATVLRL